MQETKSPRLKIDCVSKYFPGVKALQNVSLEVMPGEIHALCGENGAGKSTLMKMIAGVHGPDQGKVYIDGVEIHNLDELSAMKLGVGMVHQERSLIPGLSVAENVFAGRQHTNRFGVIYKKILNKKTKELLEMLNVDINPNEPVGRLSMAQQQMIEIAKALSHDLKILILDEPTAALTITETEQLFKVIKKLAAEGVSILYISHRLAEIFEITNRVTVLKDGQVTGVLNTTDVHEDELIRLMVGRDILLIPDSRRVSKNTPVVLELEGILSDEIKNASLKVKKGEIVCLAGLIGAGRTELCETIFGLRSYKNGTIKINGQERKIKSPSKAMENGVGMVPEDRKEAGLFLRMSIRENIISTDFKSVSINGIISEQLSTNLANDYVKKLRIATPHIHQTAENLSGGNQQKLLLSKWLTLKPDLLIIDEPTKGVDVGAREDIYKVLRELAERGIGLLVVSSDLPEVLTIAHRIVVMSEGQTVGEMDAKEATEIKIIQMASPKGRG
jgi:ABC-type sugar transport system ATPase subunit